jgi:hypothetical protein
MVALIYLLLVAVADGIVWWKLNIKKANRNEDEKHDAP